MTTQKRLDRFWRLVDITYDCWVWKGYVNSWGYGYSQIDNKLWRVHRFVYTLLVGDIPKGLVIDHVCRNRLCVNPDHLEAVTSKENTLRGTSFAAVNSKKTYCKRGHALNYNNVYLRSNNQRNCKKCRAIACEKWRVKNRVTEANQT